MARTAGVKKTVTKTKAKTARKPVAKKVATKKTAARKTAAAGWQKLQVLAGGCLCGEIRYRLTPLAADVDFCHCDMCRRWSGAPVSAWAQVPVSQFRLTKGTATPYVSSKTGIRYFCPTCGASVFMTDPDGTSVGIMLGTLDDANALRPSAHGWWSDRLSWLRLGDKLPHWPKDPPYDV
ncbi:MAG TPA: GFA family protein [Dongiaceae bacterium]|nr:GFA family protein [Dongiaceae bacterium]